MLKMLSNIVHNDWIKVLVVIIILDLFLGILRAIKQRKLNSCIGIDGMIRKIGMLVSVILLSIIDIIIAIDLIGFIPQELKEILHIEKVGISLLFILLFIVFEFLSVFKNAIQCNLPIPKKLKSLLEKIILDFTDEIKEEDIKIMEEVNK